MDNFNGKVYFFKDMQYGYIAIMDSRNSLSSGYIFLGESEEISVDFVDTREAEIKALEDAVTKKSIEHQLFLDTMSGKIQSLRAIEAPE